ncbi:hypothetical protein EJD97_004432, partial [Solanum chilense]
NIFTSFLLILRYVITLVIMMFYYCNLFVLIDCSNIQPTPKEIASLDLPDDNHVPPTQPDSSISDNEDVKPEEVSGFEDFSSKSSKQLLRRSTRVSSVGSTPPHKIIKIVHPHKYNLTKVIKPHEKPN